MTAAATAALTDALSGHADQDRRCNLQPGWGLRHMPKGISEQARMTKPEQVLFWCLFGQKWPEPWAGAAANDYGAENDFPVVFPEKTFAIRMIEPARTPAAGWSL